MERQYDLMMFMGQSNMAGRGIVTERWPEPAPEPAAGIGYEYRAISDPEHLHPIHEPFGVDENNPHGINEPGMKTGSMVTSFANAYVASAGMPIIAVSASKGGSSIRQWHGDEGDFLADAIERLDRANRYVAEHDFGIRHRYMVWCQGETDGDLGTPTDEYKDRFRHVVGLMREHRVETCFLVTIGEYNGDKGFGPRYDAIRRTQLELVRELQDVELVCDSLHTMRARGLMKDDFHYYQQAYNEVGAEAGHNAAAFVNARQRGDDRPVQMRPVSMDDSAHGGGEKGSHGAR